MMKKTGSASSPAAVIGPAVLAGLIVVLAAVLLFSMLLLSGIIGERGVRPLAVLALTAGCISTSFITACRSTSGNRFLRALAAGGCLFACLILLGFLWVGRPVSAGRIAVNAAAALSASCAGALLGAGVRRKKKNRRRYSK